MKATYINLPATAVLDRRLNHSHLAVLSALALFTNKEQTCYPSQQRLADIVGMSRRSVMDKLKYLEQIGHIKKSRRRNKDGGQSTNLYEIVFDQKASNLPTPNLPKGVQPALPMGGQDTFPTPCEAATAQEQTTEEQNSQEPRSEEDLAFEELHQRKDEFVKYINDYKLGLKVEDELPKFENYCRSVGKTYIDYTSGFKLWLDRGGAYNRKKAQPKKAAETKPIYKPKPPRSKEYTHLSRLLTYLGTGIFIQPHDIEYMEKATKKKKAELEELSFKEKQELLQSLGI